MALRFIGATDPTISAQGAPISPAAGSSVSLTVQVVNDGGEGGQFTLAGQTVRADNGTTHEGYLWSGQGGTGAQSVSGTAAPGGSPATVTLWTGPIATQGEFSPALSALDAILTLTDANSGAQTVYTIQGAIALPLESAVTAGPSGGAASFSFGSPASSSLSAGGTLSMQGAAVVAAPGVYWVLTLQAQNAAGAVLGQTQALGVGSQSGIAYNIGAIAGGDSIHLAGSLALYSDAGRTQALSGSPIVQISGVVASTAAVVPGTLSVTITGVTNPARVGAPVTVTMNATLSGDTAVSDTISAAVFLGSAEVGSMLPVSVSGMPPQSQSVSMTMTSDVPLSAAGGTLAVIVSTDEGQAASVQIPVAVPSTSGNAFAISNTGGTHQWTADTVGMAFIDVQNIGGGIAYLDIADLTGQSVATDGTVVQWSAPGWANAYYTQFDGGAAVPLGVGAVASVEMVSAGNMASNAGSAVLTVMLQGAAGSPLTINYTVNQALP